MAASVKVAVRVRPFNQRELDMNAVPVVEMEGKKTRISNIKLHNLLKQDGDTARENFKDFTFDYSYWSFNENDSNFITQEQVFNDLGKDVVKNAFEGYNACVFAYGQTGSGKTYTMMGSQNPPTEQGLIPRICMNMFSKMEEGKAKGTTYSTEVSYLEIYNERVKDLLTKENLHNLKVREHPKYGPYVEGLSKHLVGDYSALLEIMNRGNTNRTTASTNMNDTSSRSHAIFTMTFVQASLTNGMPCETVSKIHLVDLAGSERADATGATGTRLKEGAHINKSLVTLGSVISSLADISQHHNNKHNHKSFIPYRDSVLTWLLKDSLGGNSKTIMIAAISPADCNYGETISTLRYANRAKNIINKPTINEDPNVKLIRELRAEIDKLKRKLLSDISSEPSVLQELHKKEAKEKSLTEEWTEKWKETQKILMEEKVLALRKAGTGVVLDSNRPHLIGIDDDLLSTGITLYHLKEGETRIGSDEANDKCDILLKGYGLDSQHCSIVLEGGVATLIPYEGALCWVNGQQVDKPTRLSQGCVVLLGRTSMFRYNDPEEAEKLRREGSFTHLNLSRHSFLSRSATELDSSALAEESNALEGKRKQLEAEEFRLQKESLELTKQKEILEQQKHSYQQLQQEKEQAWTADIQLAQKEIEEKKQKLEIEYAAHRRRLADDWKRLEEQEQETLASLQSKEADLKKRRELLEWEVEQEMEQIESEAVRVDALKLALEKKQFEVIEMMDSVQKELKDTFENSNDVKTIMKLDDNEFAKKLAEEIDKIKDWKESSVLSINKEREALTSRMEALAKCLEESVDPNEKNHVRNELTSCNDKKMELDKRFSAIEQEFKEKFDIHKQAKNLLIETRKSIKQQEKECDELNADVEKGEGRISVSARRIERLESDLALIADQEKLIVNQLAHINSSKQKLLTIIENSPEVVDDDEGSPSKTKGKSKYEKEWKEEFDVKENGQNGRFDHSIRSKLSSTNSTPLKTIENRDISSFIQPMSTFNSNEEVEIELRRLIGQIHTQKAVVLECLENDSDGKELNHQMNLLQQLRSQYLQMESFLGGSKSSWLGYDDEDEDSFLIDKVIDGNTTPGGDSELDESEAFSSVTDHDDHIQMLVEQRVQKRLAEIFEQLKRDGKSPHLTNGWHRRSLGRSMPSDLNNPFSNGYEDNFVGRVRIPRSVSMSSTNWPTLNNKRGVIPGLLDISIQSYILRGAGKSEHYQYEILITTPNEQWTVLRRYTRFSELRNQMKKKYGERVSKIPFPGKRIFRRKSEAVARERKKLLEEFLRNLIQICCNCNTCPLRNCDSTNVRQALIAFSPFFEKGIFDSTKYSTS